MDDLLFPKIKLDELEVDDIKTRRELLKEKYERKEKDILDTAREKILRITNNCLSTSTIQDKYPGRLESLNKNLISKNSNNNSPEDRLDITTNKKRKKLTAEIDEEKSK